MTETEDLILQLKNLYERIEIITSGLRNFNERLDRQSSCITDCENSISNLSGSMRVLNRRLEKVKAGEDR